MAIIVGSASAATAAAAPVIVPEDTTNPPATPEPPADRGLKLLEERPSRIGLGKRRAARSPSLERHDRAAVQAVKRRLMYVPTNIFECLTSTVFLDSTRSMIRPPLRLRDWTLLLSLLKCPLRRRRRPCQTLITAPNGRHTKALPVPKKHTTMPSMICTVQLVPES